MRDVSDLLSIAHCRMRSTLLWSQTLPSPEDVVGWFGATHAQDYEPAKWAVAMRTAEVGNADLDRLVDEGRILRTHALRPTWHFVLPEDIRWLQALTAPRVHVLNGHYYRLHGLDEGPLARCERLIGRWLDEDGDLTRKQIGERLGVEGIERELIVRYFQSHGPATIGDFRWWSSLTVAQIRRGLELAGDRLHSEKLGDHELWSVDPTPVRPRAHATVHLLQAYDEYTVAFADTKQAVDAAGVASPPRVIDGRAFNHALIVDGQLAGRWRRRLSRAHVELEVRPSRQLSEAEREVLEDAGRAYGRFHGLPVHWKGSVGDLRPR